MTYTVALICRALWHGGCNGKGRTELMSFGSKKLLLEKKMKKALSTITLLATLALGSTFTFAEGIIVSDRSGIIVSDRATTCKEVKDGIFADVIEFLEGIIVSDRSGIIVSDRSNNCTSTEGIIVSDRTGIIVSD